MRPAYGDSQTATLATSENAARKIKSAGGQIRIGWIQCSIEERVDVKRCYKCWEAGHVAANCSGPDRKNACLNRGAADHRAKECKSEKHCPLCEEAGHRADTSKCPKFREALNKAKGNYL
ncbi:unnamed protein product [Psylliodes chrysocephalus]|uniref:CCHC-type domain-containing protein n=1 Tax=Psylliodes chrysocephalus TaxID=3402493 RepID=A0A9P0GF00_9CUCU|nr:unnamed protein product [Psylliodes chrysocephala]